MDISKLPDLERDLYEYEKLFKSLDFKAVISDVYGAYIGKKPVSSIDLSNVKLNDVVLFIDQMDAYFFVEVLNVSESDEFFAGTIYISRFKNIVKIALKSVESNYFEWKKEGDRELADLDGLLHGKTPEEIYDYCVEQGLLHLIK